MKTLERTHILSRIVEAKRKRLEELRMRVPEAIVKKMASVAAPRPSFLEALARPGRTRIIAEVKKASPSAGTLIDQLDVAQVATAYRDAGAAAVSVVTEEDFFQGSLGWVRIAADASGLPVLRKDFLFDPYQVAETRAGGASAVLLIAAILGADELGMLIRATGDFGLDALVEVHDEAELDEALEAGAVIVGVNNRDLRTFEVDLETSIRLGQQIPAGVLFVAESGIRNPDDIRRLAGAGASAVLVGERLITSQDPGRALEELA